MFKNIEPAQAARRRTVLKGAAWATPLVAVSTASPGIAASGPCVGQGGEWVQTTPGTYQVAIPDCITKVEYEVRGGGGAGPGVAGPRGSGAVVKGQMVLQSGTARTFTVYVAGGGQQATGGIGEGGTGYGRGGRGTNSYTGALSYGGGGGSAIKVGAGLLVVAGGGGGGCRAGHLNASNGAPIVEGILVNTPNNVPGWPFGNRAAGGNEANGLCYGLTAAGMNSVGVLTYPSIAGRSDGGGGAAGGGTRWITPANKNWKFKSSNAGSAGGGHGSGANQGGNGGNAATPLTGLAIQTSPVAGGGGGGYAGGGGGGLLAVKFKDYERETVAVGSGAAASSYVRSSSVSGVDVVSGVVSSSGLSPLQTRGHHGRVWLRWS